MRVVIATGEALPQQYLIARLAAEFDLAGIVIYAPRQSRGPLRQRLRRVLDPRKTFHYLHTRRRMARYDKQAEPLVERLFHPRELPPNVPLLRVENINDAEAVRFVETLRPDLLCVNGTNLLREPMLALLPQLPYGIINLHTGLSPYSRGGNCNLFMLLEGHPELVGVTVHHIDRGIDSGDIIITARAPLDRDDAYETIEAKNFRLGIDLMVVALRQLAEGRAARVPQWEKGKLFLRRTGYVYEPSLRLQANRAIEQGLIRRYLDNREASDRGVRLIGELE
jgi:methionyl-tRNA formyltransferase